MHVGRCFNSPDCRARCCVLRLLLGLGRDMPRLWEWTGLKRSELLHMWILRGCGKEHAPNLLLMRRGRVRCAFGGSPWKDLPRHGKRIGTWRTRRVLPWFSTCGLPYWRGPRGRCVLPDNHIQPPTAIGGPASMLAHHLAVIHCEWVGLKPPATCGTSKPWVSTSRLRSCAAPHQASGVWRNVAKPSSPCG